MGTIEARLGLGHDSKGKRAGGYENPMAVATAKTSVQLMGNSLYAMELPKPKPVYPYADVTPLARPGSLGPLGTPAWLRAINLANLVVNDATSMPFPRTGSLSAKLLYVYHSIKDVSYPRVSPVHLRS